MPDTVLDVEDRVISRDPALPLKDGLFSWWLDRPGELETWVYHMSICVKILQHHSFSR